jgi:hypothetical protein
MDINKIMLKTQVGFCFVQSSLRRGKSSAGSCMIMRISSGVFFIREMLQGANHHRRAGLGVVG